MELIFLGTSGFGITPIRNLPSILIDKCILIDCGEGCLKSLYRNNINLKNLKAIFITHFHPDHTLGLISLLSKLSIYSQDSTITEYPPIYVPEGMSSQLNQIISATFSSFLNRKFQLKIIELKAKPNQELQLTLNNKEYNINWIKTVHSPICYAYKFNQAFVISGDTAPFSAFQTFLEQSSILIHEASFYDKDSALAHELNHSTPMDVAKIARESKIKQVFLYHIPDIDKMEEKKFVADARILFSNLFVAHDGDKIIYSPNSAVH